MASRSKRNRNSYKQGITISSTAMPQPNAAGLNGKTTNYYDDSYPAIVPTAELQELYNTWRQQQELDAHLKEQAQAAPGSSDGGSQHLRPHSAVGMSRSPSYASTSHSVTGGMNNMDLGDDKPAKKKQGRHGPLEALNKAGAALVRKLSACPNCRLRKVKCDHYNFRLLEDAYQRSKRIAPPTAQRARYNNPENTRTQQQDLIGVGVGPNLTIPPSQYFTFDEFGGEQDDLLLNVQASPLSPNSTSPLYFLPGPSRSQNTVPSSYNNYTNNYTNYTNYNYNNNNNNNYSSMPSMPTTAVDSSYAYLPSFTPIVSSGAPVAASGTQTTATDPVGDRHIAIGRRVASIGQQFHGYQGGGYLSSLYGGSTTQGDGQWEWECLYGDDGTASSVSYPHSNYSGSNEAPQACRQRYGEREHLEAHFQKDHVPFENGQIYFFCTLHGQHYDYEMMGGQCPFCPQGTGYYEGGHATTAAGLDGGWFSLSPALAGAGNTTNNSDRFQEQWLFGNVVSQPDPGTGQRKSGRVPSKDGGLSGGGPFGPFARSGTVTQLDMWNSASYGGGGGWGGSYSAANQGGGRRRGNFTFPGGDSFSSLSSPGDLPLGPSAGEGGNNNAHRYGDARVNLVLSPPPSSFLKTMPFASLTSKMLLSPLISSPSSKTSDAIYAKHDTALCLPSTAAPSTTKASGQTPVTATRGRARARSYCPYYAYGKELMGARQSRSIKRSASDIRSRSSVSISAGLRWPSGGSTFDHSSSSHLATSKLLILLSVVMVFVLTMTHALPSSPQTPSSSFTAAKIAEKSSIVCVVFGLVGMWLVRKHHKWFRSRRQTYRDEQKDPVFPSIDVTRDHLGPSANGKQGVYSHAHAHAHVHVHPQASAAAAG